jgi:amino acid transporter
MSLSIAAFQFIGVEIPAATALEARKSSKLQPDDDSFIERETPTEATLAKRMSSRWQTLNNTSRGRMASFTPRGPATEALQFSATKLPIIAGITYFVSGLLVCLNVEWNDENLPITWTASTSTDILSNVYSLDGSEYSTVCCFENVVQLDARTATRS